MAPKGRLQRITVVQGAMSKKMMLQSPVSVQMIIDEIIANQYPLRGTMTTDRMSLLNIQGTVLAADHIFDTQPEIVLTLQLARVKGGANKASAPAATEMNIDNFAAAANEPMHLKRIGKKLILTFGTEAGAKEAAQHLIDDIYHIEIDPEFMALQEVAQKAARELAARKKKMASS